MSFSNWKSEIKRTEEDNLLKMYWEQVHGIIFTEVFVGKGGINKEWKSNAKSRRIDGVRIVPSSKTNGLSGDIITFNTFIKKSGFQEFQQVLLSGQIEVIEIKRSLDRLVLGQVIIGKDLLEIEYKLTNVKKLVICKNEDSVLEDVCKRRNIAVWTPEKKFLVTRQESV